MPHPKDGYHLANGDKVPSVTTILGQFKDPGGLLQWAFKKGKNPAIKRLYDASQDAKDIGTITHALVEDDVYGREIVRPANITDAVWDAVMLGFGAYQDWKRRSRLIVIQTEVGLVSEKYRYGGTLDALTTIGDEAARNLADWKTSNAIYADYVVQIAAYANLVEENGLGPIVGGYDLCRFSKEFGDFHHLHLADLGGAFKAFLNHRENYDIYEVLKRRIK